jgi:beta-N-acetylhexosaminidase
MAIDLPLGPVMLDLAGPSLSGEEQALLLHPLVGGVILFTRNFESPGQLHALTTEIHALRQPQLLIAVDHEGGRVQRFRDGFLRLPPMRALGTLWDADRARARAAAEATGFVLGSELRSCGVDLSFTPVLDLDYGESEVIGNRAFHRDPQAVTELAAALNAGLRRACMANVGKHFPGHGFVAADSHHAIPMDTRTMDELTPDLEPYREHKRMGLAAVMPAHVIYEKIDSRPAGFSTFWLQKVLRGELGFDGVIFSDDLSMEGASEAGDIVERAEAAIGAGCDMVLVCNNPASARRLLAAWKPAFSAESARRLQSLLPDSCAPRLGALRADTLYQAACAAVAAMQP